MADENRFKQPVIALLAKRAGYQCSNPACNALTSGPSEEPSGSVNVGMAAHIYGANPGSARYDESMSSVDRSAVANGIWLCANCHKLVDDDPEKYPSALLFEWEIDHRRLIGERVGKTAAAAREKFEARHLESLGRLSYLAERLVLEKDRFWEYLLIAEVMRFELAPIAHRWDALKRGLYIRACSRIPKAEGFAWVTDRSHEMSQIISAFSGLTNDELARGWGQKGVPGDEVIIIATARLFAELAARTLEWEEKVRFALVHETFEEVRKLFDGIAGPLIEQIARIPEFLTRSVAGASEGDQFLLELAVALPIGWSDKVHAALESARFNFE